MAIGQSLMTTGAELAARASSAPARPELVITQAGKALVRADEAMRQLLAVPDPGKGTRWFMTELRTRQAMRHIDDAKAAYTQAVDALDQLYTQPGTSPARAILDERIAPLLDVLRAHHELRISVGTKVTGRDLQRSGMTLERLGLDDYESVSGRLVWWKDRGVSLASDATYQPRAPRYLSSPFTARQVISTPVSAHHSELAKIWARLGGAMSDGAAERLAQPVSDARQLRAWKELAQLEGDTARAAGIGSLLDDTEAVIGAQPDEFFAALGGAKVAAMPTRSATQLASEASGIAESGGKADALLEKAAFHRGSMSDQAYDERVRLTLDVLRIADAHPQLPRELVTEAEALRDAIRTGSEDVQAQLAATAPLEEWAINGVPDAEGIASQLAQLEHRVGRFDKVEQQLDSLIAATTNQGKVA